MIYFETLENQQIGFTHYVPFDEKQGLHKSREELLKTGYLVETLPTYSDPIPPEKVPVLYYTGTDFYWKLEDAPTPPSDQSTEMQALNNRIAELETLMNAMTGGTTE